MNVPQKTKEHGKGVYLSNFPPAGAPGERHLLMCTVTKRPEHTMDTIHEIPLTGIKFLVCKEPARVRPWAYVTFVQNGEV